MNALDSYTGYITVGIGHTIREYYVPSRVDSRSTEKVKC